MAWVMMKRQLLTLEKQNKIKLEVLDFLTAMRLLLYAVPVNLFSWGCRRFAPRSVRAPPTSAPAQPVPASASAASRGRCRLAARGAAAAPVPLRAALGTPRRVRGVLVGLRAAPVLCKGHRTGAWALMRVTALFLARGEGIRSTQS